MKLSGKEKKFISQSEIFLEKALRGLGLSSLKDVDTEPKKAKPLVPTIIQDFRNLTSEEKDCIVQAYYGDNAAASFIILNAPEPPVDEHPILNIAKQLCPRIPLCYPMNHPMEGHPEALSRFGQPDGTLKLYNLDTDGTKKYREQGETSEAFKAHNDGLGYAGDVEAFILYCDSGPLWGGFTYIQNVVAESLKLAVADRDAFDSLFLPDAIVALRPRGKGAIKVTSPVIYINENKDPQVFLRESSGEYEITWRNDYEPLVRARRFMISRTQAFSDNSSFVHFMKRGEGCIVRNQWTIHGRTSFVDGNKEHQRVLARKWYMRTEEMTKYKHVPSIRVYRDYADLFPEQFSKEMLDGEWNYSLEKGGNKQIK